MGGGLVVLLGGVSIHPVLVCDKFGLFLQKGAWHHKSKRGY